MIIYLVKGIACSLVLWAFHHFFLEKERMHQFNRFYLLAAPVISFLLPFIPLRRAGETAVAFPAGPAVGISPDESLFRILQTTAESDALPAAPDLSQWLTGAYLLVTFFLLFRLLRGIVRIHRLIKASKQYELPEATLVLLQGRSEIFTFKYYVFCSWQDYRDNRIPASILLHEFAHVKQKHTRDILFMELAGALYWFNPFMILYKKAIRLNHEFLADQYVTGLRGDVSGYQRLLLDWLTGGAAPALASGFNYSQTKKRLMMMTKTPNWNRIMMKGTCLSMLTAGLFYAVSDEIQAQVAPPPPPVEKTNVRDAAPPPPPFNPGKLPAAPPPPPPPPVEPTYIRDVAPPPPPFDPGELPVVPPPPPPVEPEDGPVGLTEEELADYKVSFEKNKVEKVNEKGVKVPFFVFQDSEKERLWDLTRKMSPEQRREQEYTIFKKEVPRKNPPSEELFESFKRADAYGVWLNGRKIDNSALNEYKHSDIAGYIINKLQGAAKKGRSYTHQLNIETNAYFDANFKKRMADLYIVSQRIKMQEEK